MMKYITTLDTTIPAATSVRALRSSRSSERRGRSPNSWFNASSASTSCAACQKKRYGLIVVPKIATKVKRYSFVNVIFVRKVPFSTALHYGFARNAATT
jgi:hypothetical protein